DRPICLHIYPLRGIRAAEAAEVGEIAQEPRARVVDEGVTEGHDNEGEEGARGHAADERAAEAGEGNLAADAAAEGQGHAPEDGGEGGHHDGAQTVSPALQDGRGAVPSASPQLVDVVDDDDAVVDHDADHEDASDEGD